MRNYSNMCYVDAECSICGADWTILWVVDKDYGADADGNRGVTMVSPEIDSTGCAHDVEEDLVDKTQDIMYAEMKIY